MTFDLIIARFKFHAVILFKFNPSPEIKESKINMMMIISFNTNFKSINFIYFLTFFLNVNLGTLNLNGEKFYFIIRKRLVN